MAHPLQAIDGAILAMHQKIADFVEYHTGRNCFTLARLFGILGPVQFYILAFLNVQHHVAVWKVFPMILTGLFLTYATGAVVSHIEKKQKPGHRNAYEMLWPVRLQFIPVACFSLRGGHGVELFVGAVCSVAMLGFFYFLACTPLPPGERQLERTQNTDRKFA